MNNEGESLFEKAPYFSLPLIGQYRKIYAIKNNLENKRREYQRSEKSYKDRNASAWKKLKANRAFRENTCYLPPQKRLPLEPNTKCETETECREDGSAICFSRFFGTEGCGIALREIRIPGILSAPGCAAAAAELANEKYDMDDAFVDFLHGLADDVADNWMESESWWDKAWGVILKLGNYSVKIDKANQCTSSFVEHYYGPKRRWFADVNRIKREPIETRDKCNSNIEEVNNYYNQINSLVEKRREASKDFELASVKYEKLLNEKKPISHCN